MPVVKSHTDVLKDITSKKLSPVYLLHGEEPYYIDVLAEAFEQKTIDAGLKSFNQHVLYGRDTSAGDIVDAASRFPMMSPLQLVLVKEAQDLADIGQLEQYLAKPVPSTVLVIAYRGKKLRANTKVYKNCLQRGVVFESKTIYLNQVPNFVRSELKRRKREAEPGVADLLAEHLGAELAVLSGALDKLTLNVSAERSITLEDVESHVGISRQFNIFEFQDAIGTKDFERAVRIGYMLSQNERENPLPRTLSSLYTYFSGLFAIRDVMRASEAEQKEATGVYSPFRLGKLRQAAGKWSYPQLMSVLMLLGDFDLKSKGVGHSSRSGESGGLTLELVERLVAIAA